MGSDGHLTLTEKNQLAKIGAKYNPLCSMDERYDQ